MLRILLTRHKCYVFLLTRHNFNICFVYTLSEYNLGALYSNHRVAKVLLWRYFALPLLPVNEIMPQLKRIKAEIKQKIVERADRKAILLFHNNYIKKFWVKTIRPERFSVFGNRHKTNNCAESLHKVMKMHIPHKLGFFPWFSAMHSFVIKKGEDDKTHIDAGEEVRNPIAIKLYTFVRLGL